MGEASKRCGSSSGCYREAISHSNSFQDKSIKVQKASPTKKKKKVHSKRKAENQRGRGWVWPSSNESNGPSTSPGNLGIPLLVTNQRPFAEHLLHSNPSHHL